MRSKYFSALLAILTVTLALPALAGKAGNGGIPTVSSFQSRGGAGVTGDPSYSNGETSTLGSYFGVNGTHAILGTYNTSRTLHFEFDTNNVAWQKSGLPASFDANVDFDGINQWGAFTSQGNGSTAGMKVYLQFYWNNNTYQLEYGQLASYRMNSTQWLLTTEWFEYTPIAQSSSAILSVFRRNRQTTFGGVSMPITFTMTLK
jgi:hypothetical protein